jgi:transposase
VAPRGGEGEDAVARMMRSRTQPLAVSLPVGARLKALASSRKASHALVRRADIVLDAVGGYTNAEIARRRQVSTRTVACWLARFRASPDVDSLRDLHRSGRPSWIPLQLRLEVMRIACTRPEPELSVARATARLRVATESAKSARKEKKLAAKGSRETSAAAENAWLASARKPRGGTIRTGAARQLQMAAARAKCRLNRAAASLEKAEAALRSAADDVDRAKHADKPAPFAAVWTIVGIQQELQRTTGAAMSLSEVGRTLRCRGLRPHHQRVWLHSPDPDFRPKAARICELYLQPPPGAVVLCVDEKPGMLAREDRHPPRYDRMSRAIRREFEYVRHGTSTLLAAFEVATGKAFGRCWARTAEGLNRFLEELAIAYPKGEVYIVWDNLNTHKGAAVDDFSARHGGRFHFVYTPLHASWVNQVEIWFGILQRRVLSYGSFTSTDELDAAVMDFISHWNTAEAHPFRWRFRGDFQEQRVHFAA